MSMEERRAAVEARLQQREEERQADLERRRQQRELEADPNESATAFQATFSAERAAAVDELDALVAAPPASKAATTAAFDDLGARVAKLHKFLAESTLFLPSYDVRATQKQIDELQTKINEQRDLLLPKKPFAFKNRKKKASASAESGDGSKAPAAEDPGSAAAASATAIADAQSQFGFCSKTGERLELEGDELQGKDVRLADLENCQIYLKGSPNALHIKNLKNCRVCMGPVSRSLLISNCEGCVFALACQQLRVHDTNDTTFYLHVTGKAIIEGCKDMRFAPYTWQYPGQADDYAASGLNKERNSWNDVDDFHWLRNDEPSPNWAVLPEAERFERGNGGSRCSNVF